ncbi:MAG: DEAD/DEAH box helicase [Bradymonadia bacterium]
MSTFDSAGLIEPLQKAVADLAYEVMTPIQAKSIPPLLEGRDVLGCAQTGTGKTAAFLLPIIQHLVNERKPRGWGIRALILTPTRELAAQIGENFAQYAKHVRLSHYVIFGGVNQKPQVAALERGLDVVVATPGRLLDLHGQGFFNFDKIEFFVLDEADCMLDMGFIHDIRKVLDKLPPKRQNLLFSATMPGQIVQLANRFLSDPVRVEVNPQSSTAERIIQKVMFVERPNKRRLLAHLLRDNDVESAIVFTRTKHGANRVVKDLGRAGIEALAIHGNKSQGARTRALQAFKSREIRILVATDIASRGIDVSGVSHVFNFDLPNVSESYVHRIGRTARAGRDGIAIAFCDETESDYLQDIEKLTGQPLDIVDDHEWHFPAAIPIKLKPGERRRSGKNNQGQKSRSQQGTGQSRRRRRRPPRGQGANASNRPSRRS